MTPNRLHPGTLSVEMGYRRQHPWGMNHSQGHRIYSHAGPKHRGVTTDLRSIGRLILGSTYFRGAPPSKVGEITGGILHADRYTTHTRV